MSKQDKSSLQTGQETSWGPKLFYGVLIAVLVFFWWMVIYPHGVTGH
ncbi:MAG: hypothetical protein GY784_00200 [Gammaproteobacteria bacterium]|nr:hypothetical protein [Gammaproteobacteria bacterium]